MTKRLKNKDKRELEKKILVVNSMENESEYNEILEKVKKLISGKRTESKSRDYISIYSITRLLKSYFKRLNSLKKTSAHSMEQLIYEECGQYINIAIGDFDSKKETLCIGVKTNPLIESEQYKNIVFSKKNNELHIVSTELDDISSAIIFKTTGNVISDLYSKIIEYSEYKDINSGNIKIPGSIFCYGINADKVTLEGNINDINLQITLETNTGKTTTNSNSSVLTNVIQGHEDELLKRTYVRINECPKYFRKALKEARKKQLTVKNNAKKLALKLYK